MFSERFRSLPIMEKVKYGIYSSLFLLTLALAGCDGENGTTSTNSVATPVSTATPAPVLNAQDVLCQTTVTVEAGDTLLGSVAKRARDACPNLSNQEIMWGAQDKNNINHIEVGQTLNFTDIRGY